MAMFTDPVGRYEILEPRVESEPDDPVPELVRLDPIIEALLTQISAGKATALAVQEDLARRAPLYICTAHLGMRKEDACGQRFYGNRPDVCPKCGTNYRRTNQSLPAESPVSTNS